MQLPLILTLRPSRRLAVLLLLAHGGALAVVSVLSISEWIRLVLLLLVLCSAALSWRRAHGRQRIVRLVLRADGKLEYARLNGESGAAPAHPHSMVAPQLTLLLFRLGKRLEALVLLPDSLDDEDFRRLRLWLRWQAEAREKLPQGGGLAP